MNTIDDWLHGRWPPKAQPIQKPTQTVGSLYRTFGLKEPEKEDKPKVPEHKRESFIYPQPKPADLAKRAKPSLLVTKEKFDSMTKAQLEELERDCRRKGVILEFEAW